MPDPTAGDPDVVAVFMVWTDADLGAAELIGPWREVVVAAPGLAFVDSDDTLSRVYHEVKWSLPDGAALAVAPVAGRPKAKGLAAGTHTWLQRTTTA
ncbi:hypothetical protein [Nocardioides aquiterrae]|uniref:Uncharacterized protein n=1 Tax=Nocardioides aquiterrae TaxID=203799 RepID=A0ABN1UL25_9ACTN